MKYIKTYEENFTGINYLLIEEYGDLYFDKIIFVDEKNNKIKTKTLRYYNYLTDEYSHPSAELGEQELYIDALSKLIIYKSDNFYDTKQEMRKIVTLKRTANKYNL